MSDQPTSEGEQGAGDETGDAVPPPPPLQNVGPAGLGERVTLTTLLERIGSQVSEATRSELSHAMVALTAVRNTLDVLVGSVKRLEDRVAALEGGALGTASGGPPPPGWAPGVPDAPPLPTEGAVAERLAALEGRLAEGDDDGASREILDAIVAVAQHLEAVQTAVAWAIVRELRGPER